MKEPSAADLKQKLRGAGLRGTSARLAVLRQLYKAQSPTTHADVAEHLAAAGFDRATIYRNLIDLTDAGFVRRTDVGDHVWRFELVSDELGGDEPHPHFICSECGTVECLPEGAVEVRAVRGAPRSLRKQGVEVQLRGRCNDCA